MENPNNEDIIIQIEETLHLFLFDNCLSWCQQINNIVSKISSRLGLMCRLRTYLPTESVIMYYNGYILPLFNIVVLRGEKPQI